MELYLSESETQAHLLLEAFGDSGFMFTGNLLHAARCSLE